jgi:hypothetical protein
LQALGWNDPDIRKRVAKVDQAWYQVVTDAIDKALDEYGLDRSQFPVEAVTGLVGTFNEGMHLRMLSGISSGHRALLAWIDDWLAQLEKHKRKRASR